MARTMTCTEGKLHEAKEHIESTGGKFTGSFPCTVTDKGRRVPGYALHYLPSN